MEELQFAGVTYLLRYPKNYQQGQKYPVIFLLHGAGYRGQTTEKLRVNPYFVITETHADFPFVTVAPLCNENTWFDMFERLKLLAQAVPTMEFADPERIYIMGASMGGYGTWQMIRSLPGLFAAAVPICGGGMYWQATQLAHLPIWAFHGMLDTTVAVDESIRMVKAVKRAGGDAKLTIYPENTHDAWSDTYGNPEVFAWLLSHRRTQTPAE